MIFYSDIFSILTKYVSVSIFGWLLILVQYHQHFTNLATPPGPIQFVILIPSLPSLSHFPYPNSPPFYLSDNPSYSLFHSGLISLHIYLCSTNYPTLLLQTSVLHSYRLTCSEFLVSLQVTFATTHPCTFTKPSGAWEIPS